MIAELGSMVTTAASGGLTGILGAGLNVWAKSAGEKRQRAHEIALRKMDLDEMRLEAETADKRQALQLEAQTASAHAAAHVASFEHDKAILDGVVLTGWQVWPALLVDCVRGLTRPALTGGLLVCTVYVWDSLPDRPPESQEAVLIIHSLVYCTATALTWWFSARAMSGQRQGV